MTRARPRKIRIGRYSLRRSSIATPSLRVAPFGLPALGLARATGLEPATSGVTGRRSNQLNYARVSPQRRARDIGSPMGCQAYRTREQAVKCPEYQCFRRIAGEQWNAPS